jgi:hypothetical protein
MSDTEIGGITATAPLWKKATEAELLGIVKCLSSASYHYADDSGKEWATASVAMRTAAAEVNRLRLGVTAIVALHRHAQQLVSLNDFIDKILADARGQP